MKRHSANQCSQNRKFSQLPKFSGKDLTHCVSTVYDVIKHKKEIDSTVSENHDFEMALPK
ncbi:hypothetical protein SESBI_43926 [Sesbania bispinosa]|nr:hypothetical protein SESBI_43926 [Sesbania bispinosa]